jgi:hypothetical protein
MNIINSYYFFYFQVLSVNYLIIHIFKLYGWYKISILNTTNNRTINVIMLNQTSSFPKDIHSSLMAIVDIVFPVKAKK